MLVYGIISALALIFIFSKLNMRRVCGYDLFVDIGSSGLLMFMGTGTFSGLMAALLGGVIISLFLYAYKHTVGYDRLTIHGWRSFGPTGERL